MRSFVKPFLLLAFCLSFVGCAILGGGDEEQGTKNSALKFSQPGDPFIEVSVTSADKVWQSKKTGSTIALNSLCKKSEDPSLESLRKTILAELNNLKVDKTEDVNFDGRSAQRIRASGTADGVPVTVSLLITKKNGCAYDLTYVARATNFQKELPVFEKFLQGFHVP